MYVYTSFIHVFKYFHNFDINKYCVNYLSFIVYPFITLLFCYFVKYKCIALS